MVRYITSDGNDVTSELTTDHLHVEEVRWLLALLALMGM